MPELDAEHREALHQRLIESAGCYEGESCCLDSLDAITPLVAGWLADAWDKGYEAGSEDQSDAYWGPDHAPTRNPYRGGDDG